MARTPTLSFDRGTLILHPPPRAKSWIDYAVWDDRVERFRVNATRFLIDPGVVKIECDTCHTIQFSAASLTLKAQSPKMSAAA